MEQEWCGPIYGQDPINASWVASGLDGTGGRIGSIVPAGFEFYIRLLHPVCADPVVLWADVAQESGKLLHPTVQWDAIASSVAYRAIPEAAPPLRGTLVTEWLTRLLTILSRHTSTVGECWSCTWTGYGWDQPSQDVVDLPDRTYFLGRSSVPGVAQNLWTGELSADDRSPNIFWPTDKSWVVCTEVDLDSTLIGCSYHCAVELIAAEHFETFPVARNWSLDRGSDLINDTGNR